MVLHHGQWRITETLRRTVVRAVGLLFGGVVFILALLVGCSGAGVGSTPGGGIPLPAFTVRYDANGASAGAVPVDGKSYHPGETVTVLGTAGNLVKTGDDFEGWNSAANSTGTRYTEGATFVMGGADVTLYADWTPKTWTWTDRSAAGTLGWQSIASSSDGTHLVAAVSPGDLYTSSDSGATWIDRTGGAGLYTAQPSWRSIASSSDGTHLAALAIVGDIYTSSDSGVNWIDRTSRKTNKNGTALTGLYWWAIASSSDGTHLVAIANQADIYTSSDSGVSWTDRTIGTALSGLNWQAVTSSSGGTDLAAAVNGGDIYTSSDSGANWADRTIGTALSGLHWVAMSGSSDGSHLVAVVLGGDIYTSSDSGVSWTDRTGGSDLSGLDWQSVASSADGTHLAAVVNGGDVYTSSDSGVSWIDHSIPGSQGWQSIATSSDGSHLAGVVLGGSIWTGVYK